MLEPVTREPLEARLRLAAGLSDDGDWDEALRVLREAEHEHPNDPTLLGMLGATAQAAGAPGIAYRYYRRCVDAGAAEPAVLAAAGAGLAAFDDPDAERVLRLAAVAAPGLKLARLNYGVFLAREGLTEQALDELRAAAELDPEDPVVRQELAVVFARAGRFSEALLVLEEAEIDDDPWLLTLQALAHLNDGAGESAAETLHQAAQLAPEDWEVQLLAALSCAAQGWEDQAWTALAAAEAAGTADQALLAEVEESIEAGEEAALEMLVEEVAPSALRARLAARL